MKNIFVAILMAAMTPFVANAQVHPLAFGASVTPNTNWYKDYVGQLFDVITPASIAGNKQHTFAGGTASTSWGGVITSPLLNKLIVMPQPGDSLCGSPITVSMTGKIALVYRGGGIEFSTKALAAQTAGAIACIIVNDIPGSPVGMGAGSSGSSVTIPVFMISKADGDAMDLLYLASTPITMTISAWGRNNVNDLGFVPQGVSGWSNYATPSNQLFPAVTDMAYKGLSGAFIANFGTHNATNVKLRDTLTYTPTTGSPSVLHTGVSATLGTFTSADSIYAMLGAAEYTFAPTAVSTGRYDIKYTIVSDSADQFAADNKTTVSFYASDSVYSKGQYDFVNRVPVVSGGLAPGSGIPYLWGPMYYVAHGGTSISSAQFWLSQGMPGPITGISAIDVHAMKWVDGAGGWPTDGLVQNGELTEVAMGTYSFLSTDTSGQVFKVSLVDPSTGAPVMLDAASWYYIAVDVPSGFFLGVDGQSSPYPRVYSRKHVSSTYDYSGVCSPNDFTTVLASPGQANPPCPFPGTALVNSIDSFNFNSQKGTIPAVAMIVNNNPITLLSGDTVICVGDTVGFHDPLPGGTWSSSNPAVGTISTIGTLTGISAGTTRITYTVGSAFATIVATVNDVPSGVMTGPSSVCIGSSITLTPATAGGTWYSAPGTFATVSSGVVTGVAVGTEVISYYVSNTCGSDFSGTPITVNPLPVPVIVTAGTLLGTTFPFTTYQWLLGGTPIAGETSATYTATVDGFYAVTVTDANGCTGTSAAVGVTVPVTVVRNDIPENASVRIFPNPSTGIFNIQATGAGKLSISSMDGREVATYSIKAGTTSLHMPAGIAPGVYSCTFTAENKQTTTMKLVYEK